MVDHSAAAFPAFKVPLHVAIEVWPYFGNQLRVVPVVVPQVTVVYEGPFSATDDYPAIWSRVEVIDSSAGGIVDVVCVRQARKYWARYWLDMAGCASV